jgi:hypothetical protein
VIYKAISPHSNTYNKLCFYVLLFLIKSVEMVNSALVLSLALKSMKQILRNKSINRFLILSSLTVYAFIYPIFLLSKGHKLNFMTSNAYSKMNLDIECKLNVNMIASLSYCDPMTLRYEMADNSPSKLIFDVIHSLSSSKNNVDIAKVFTSLIMNGLPLVGLFDFVEISDFINVNIGDAITKKIMKFPLYKEKFSNFISIRVLEMRLVSRNCWTDAFLYYMKKTLLLKVTFSQ